jgi:RNA-binding protein
MDAIAAGLTARRLFLCGSARRNGAMAIELTQAQKRYLRGLGQALNPTLQIGREGVTAANEAALEPLLKRHELVKGKVQQTAEVTPQEAAAALAKSSGALLVGVVGRTFLLYRPAPERKDPIRLP